MSETSERLGEVVQHVAASPKTAAAVAGSTIAAGGGTLLETLTGWLGVVATFLGICLSLVLIVYHITQFKIMRNRENERRARAAQSPRRRFDD